MFLAVSMNVSPFDRLLPAEKIDRIGPQPPRGQRKAGARAGRVLEEQVGQVLPVRTGSLCLQPPVASLN